MTRIIAFVCAAFALFFSFASASAAEYNQYSDTIYHELWDIPWGASLEEFLQKTSLLYDFSFTVYEDVDYGTFCDSSQDSGIYLFGYPVEIEAFFAIDNALVTSSDKILIADGNPGLVSITFQIQLPSSHSEAAVWFMANDVFYNLHSSYGEPWAAYFYTDFDYPSAIALPIVDQRLDAGKLFQKGVNNNEALYAHFDNLVYTFRADLIQASSDEPFVSIAFYSLAWKGWHHYWTPENILPFEDFDGYRQPASSSATPTPAKRIDIDL